MAKVSESSVIEGVFVVEPEVFGDDRGLFVETFRAEWVPHAKPMVQANRADRRTGALVGLHYHLHQADYWYVPAGRALVALHDLRSASPTDGASQTFELGPPDHRCIYIPPGVAHGFYALTDVTITYLVDAYYDPNDELGVAWDDPDVAVEWPGREPVLSGRDQANPRRADIPADIHP